MTSLEVEFDHTGEVKVRVGAKDIETINVRHAGSPPTTSSATQPSTPPSREASNLQTNMKRVNTLRHTRNQTSTTARSELPAHSPMRAEPEPEVSSTRPESPAPKGADKIGPMGKWADYSASKKFRAATRGIIMGNILSHNATASMFDALDARQKEEKLSLYTMIIQFYLLPKGHFKTYWDIFMLTLVLLTAIWTPYRAALVTQPEMMWWEWAVDIFFYCDILITFFTGYEQGMVLVTSKKKIAMKYLSGWFLIDAVATIEWDLLARMLGEPTPDTEKVVRLTRLFKLMRLGHVRVIDQLTMTSTMDSGYFESLKFFVYVLIVAHLLGCMFLVIPKVFRPDVGEQSWIQHYKIDKMQTGEQYANALYWSLTTMTTIGYGDRGPQTTAEIIYTLVAEVVGISAFALLVSQIVKFCDLIGMQSREFDQKKNAIVQHIKTQELHHAHPELLPRITKFFNFKFSRVATQLNLMKLDGFTDLTKTLQRDVRRCINETSLRNIFFLGQSDEFEREKKQVEDLFIEFDTDNSLSLDLEEFEALIKKLGLALTPAESTAAFHAMDTVMSEVETEEVIGLEEFSEWWFKKLCNYRLPYFLNMHPCGFMETLAGRVEAMAYCDGDMLVERGDYGKHMFIVAMGQVVVQRKRYSRRGSPGAMTHDGPIEDHEAHEEKCCSGAKKSRIELIQAKRKRKIILQNSDPSVLIVRKVSIQADDHGMQHGHSQDKRHLLPIFGWLCLLKGHERRHADAATKEWEVVATNTIEDNNFCEVFCIPEKDLREIVRMQFDEEGQRHFLSVARDLHRRAEESEQAPDDDGRLNAVEVQLEALQEQSKRMEANVDKILAVLASKTEACRRR